MVPLILMGVGLVGVICLFAGTIWHIRDQQRTIAGLSFTVATERERRISIAKSAIRLGKLRDDRIEFDKAVSDAEKAWAPIESSKSQLAFFSSAPSADPQQSYKNRGFVDYWLGAVGGWQGQLLRINPIIHDLRATDQSLNQFTGPPGFRNIGHTKNYNSKAMLPGEEHMMDEGRQMWQDIFDQHTYATEVLGATRAALISEITELERQIRSGDTE
jgi:hypothetical protein